MRDSTIQKVLMTADTIGGVWTYAMDLCRSFIPYDIEVHLATMGTRLSESQRIEASEIENLKVYESDYKLEWMDSPWKDVEAAGKWLLKLESEIGPDVIHLNNYVHGNLPWSAPVMVVAHSCVLSWWAAVKKEAAPEGWDKYKRKVKAGLQAADAVVGITHSYFQEVRKFYGPFKKEGIIYNGCDASKFKADHKRQSIFAMGRIWDEAKNLRILEQVAARSPYLITIAGSTRHPSNGNEVRLQHVNLAGYLNREEIKKALAASLVYLLPAKYEPFGLSALEAALSGCLLILADIPTLREIWRDTALYFNPENPDTLVNRLQWVEDHPDQGKDLIRMSSQRALLFSLEKMSKSYVNFYQNLTASVEKTGAIF